MGHRATRPPRQFKRQAKTRAIARYAPVWPVAYNGTPIRSLPASTGQNRPLPADEVAREVTRQIERIQATTKGSPIQWGAVISDGEVYFHIR